MNVKEERCKAKFFEQGPGDEETGYYFERLVLNDVPKQWR